MTIDDIKQRLLEIERLKHDDEAAHSAEADLYQATLRAIAEGAPDAAELATEALKANAIKFRRWMA